MKKKKKNRFFKKKSDKIWNQEKKITYHGRQPNADKDYLSEQWNRNRRRNYFLNFNLFSRKVSNNYQTSSFFKKWETKTKNEKVITQPIILNEISSLNLWFSNTLLQMTIFSTKYKIYLNLIYISHHRYSNNYFLLSKTLLERASTIRSLRESGK